MAGRDRAGPHGSTGGRLPGSRLAHLATLRRLWSSEVNRAAVALLSPSRGDQVVDLGAGLGPATGLLADRVGSTGRVVAVDPSRAMRLVLRARTRVRRRGRVEVRDGATEALPVASGSVDAVLSLNAMHHWDDLAAAAPELARVLRPGGRLLLVDEDFSHPGHSLGRVHDGQHGHHEGPPPVDRDRLTRLLAEAGFAEVTARDDRVGRDPALVVQATR